MHKLIPTIRLTDVGVHDARNRWLSEPDGHTSAMCPRQRLRSADSKTNDKHTANRKRDGNDRSNLTVRGVRRSDSSACDRNHPLSRRRENAQPQKDPDSGSRRAVIRCSGKPPPGWSDRKDDRHRARKQNRSAPEPRSTSRVLSPGAHAYRMRIISRYASNGRMSS